MAKGHNKAKVSMTVTFDKINNRCVWTHEGRVVEGVRYEDSKYGYLPKWTVELEIAGSLSQKWATREAGWASLGVMMAGVEREMLAMGQCTAGVTLKVGNKVIARAKCVGNKVTAWELHHDVTLGLE